MTSTLRITVDSDAVSVAQAIRAATGEVPLVILSDAALGELADELGSHEAAGAFLVEVASEVDRPIAVNVERDGGESTTAFISPRGWTSEHLAGWVGGKRSELEGLFGPARMRGTE